MIIRSRPGMHTSAQCTVIQSAAMWFNVHRMTTYPTGPRGGSDLMWSDVCACGGLTCMRSMESDKVQALWMRYVCSMYSEMR